jgi:signal transduction histidine kinase/PAS domain-containing protein
MLNRQITQHFIHALARLGRLTVYARATIVIAGFAFHVLAFPLLNNVMGSGAATLSGVPVLLAGLLLGSGGGFIGGMASVVLDTILISVFIEPSWLAAFKGSGGLGHLLLVVGGTTVGLVVDLAQRTQQELEERRKVEEALRQSEKRLRLLSNQVPAIVWTTDEHLSVTSVIGSGLGALPQPDSTQDQIELFAYFQAGDHQTGFMEAHQRALTGESVVREHVVDDRIYESRIEPLRNRDREPIGVIGIAVDITNRKLAEKALQRQVQELTVLHQVAAIGTSASTEDELITKATEIVGTALYPDSFGVLFVDQERQRLVPHASYRSHHPPRDVPLTEVDHPVFASGASVRFQSKEEIPKALAADPETQSMLSVPIKHRERVIGIINAERKRAGAFTGTDERLLEVFAEQLATGIEKVRLFEEVRRNAREAKALADLSATLRITDESEAVIETVLSACISVLEGDWGAILVPGQHPNTLVVAQNKGNSGFLDGVVLDEKHSTVGHVFRTQKPYLSTDIARDPHTHPTVRERLARQIEEPMSAIYAPLRSGQTLVGVLAIGAASPKTFTDIDLGFLNAVAEIAGNALYRSEILGTLEQRVADRTRELAEANAQLQKLDQLKSEFISNVSHELRTPLTNINFYLNLLLAGSESRRDKYLAILQHETNHLKSLIEAILDLSRLEAMSDGPKVQMALVDVSDIARQVVTNHLELAQAAGVQLVCKSEQSNVFTRGNRSQLIQVVTNLVNNSINYTPAGGQIEVDVLAAGSDVCITVRDTGLGMNEEEKARVFDRFYRSDRVIESSIPGTGLGLSIVKEIVDIHGGRIGVESEINRGTTFTVCFPTVSPAPA